MFYAVEHDDFVVFCCRTPHGVRGLKFYRSSRVVADICRTPHGVRGLKYTGGAVGGTYNKSHPAWGAWIEMSLAAALGVSVDVAPRMGCVD